MKYEFSAEREERKKRNLILEIVGVMLLLIGLGFGFTYCDNNGLLPGGQGKLVAAGEAAEVNPLPLAKADKSKEQVAAAATTPLTLVIDKSEFKLYLKQGEEVKKYYLIAIGKNPGQKQKAGDLTTPTGAFTIEEIIDASDWSHDFHDGKGVIAGAYGPWFISLATGWEGIGIHGTHDPASLGTMVSEGCIRMHNADITDLKKRVKPGLEVIIQE
ncbi:MAG: L,D-transpeptidase [Acidaminococcaceae bacterium]